MSLLPDADAFVRAILHNPSDNTTRLVFADWLEETDTPSNVAWAHFIRVNAELATRKMPSERRKRLEIEAELYAYQIEAQLVIPVAVFVLHHKLLLQFLPQSNLAVRLEGFDIPQPAIEYLPESVAREDLAILLDVQGSHLILAVPDPAHQDTIQKLELILNRKIIAVRAEIDDIRSAITKHYGVMYECVDSVFHEFPDVTLINPNEFVATEPPVSTDRPVVRLVSLLIGEALRMDADGISFVPRPTSITVSYRRLGEAVRSRAIPRRLCQGVVARIALMSMIPLDNSQRGTVHGSFQMQYQGNTHLVRTAIETTPGGPLIDLDIS